MKKLLTGILILSALFCTNYCTFAANNLTGTSKNQVVKADLGPYMRSLQRKIKMNWTPPKTNAPNRVTLLFKLNRNGEILSSSVVKSSGDANVDKAAQEALKASAPFGKFPTEFKGQNIDIQFTFDYNVFATNITN